ncbi:tetratricopeptide repeat protein [Massilia forsythiae]|uniref:Tetratricopeptide repeat protein n=1 Tax=Massilia forsythiae TaxID=2728020 RepID=A0A7Z2VYL4_9BURK|nr:tetratricopeptide repeat protein [Massilia forsythiae]QJE01656.1 tetratricopeptide repeat protein [Massilia forsythiae]
MPPPPTDDLLRQALQLHQRGRLDAAAALYRQVLAQAPRQFDALHLLGVIARQQGDAAQAAALIRAALAVRPDQARAHCNLGAALQDLDDPTAALASYDEAVRLDPRYALAWDNRGNALRRLRRPQEALDSHERALALRPDYPEAWCHRAIALQELGCWAEAADSAARALRSRPAWTEALLALGNALQALERFDDAVAAYDRALAAADAAGAAAGPGAADAADAATGKAAAGANGAGPDQAPGGRADIWCARGAALKKAGAPQRALDSYERALALRPDYVLAWHYRANVLRALGRRDEAVAAYRRALELGADAAEIGFALAALGEGALPGAAPADYVKNLFDQYAPHFERHLVGVLGYRTPALLDALLRRHLAAPVETALDLGCGTGLCGPLLRPLARHLAGVDLSPRMLEAARAGGAYDELACADIGPWLDERRTGAGLALAADVLVYFGDLAPLFGQVRRALLPGGLFAFSVEAAQPGAAGYAILPSNRFAHAPAYVERCALDAGFTVVEREDAVLRREDGRDVAGCLVLLRAGTAIAAPG